VAGQVINDFQIDPKKLRAIGRMAGAMYCRTMDHSN
jgi:hypothetical protein